MVKVLVVAMIKAVVFVVTGGGGRGVDGEGTGGGYSDIVIGGETVVFVVIVDGYRGVGCSGDDGGGNSVGPSLVPPPSTRFCGNVGCVEGRTETHRVWK